MIELPDWILATRYSLLATREEWNWRGQVRPAFATAPRPGQVSVWDFPRPPRLVPDTREVVVHWGDVEVARTRRAMLVLETSHPPIVYILWDDVARHLLHPAGGRSFCEWKGLAQYWDLANGDKNLPGVAWSYPLPLPGAEAMADCIAFYPASLNCSVDGAKVRPQPGGFYGGWITPELVGPFKGEPDSERWYPLWSPRAGAATPGAATWRVQG